MSDFLLGLDRLFKSSQAQFFSGSPLAPILDYHFETGGKRLRPLLVEAVFQWSSSKFESTPMVSLEDRLRFALAVELVHNATLIHDDLQDGDVVRRGMPTVWKKYGLPQAVNAGDAWFFVALRLILEGGFSLDQKDRLASLLSSCTLAVIDGQSREFALQERFRRGEAISLEEYWQMVDGKTAALFSMTIEGGLILAGSDPSAFRPLVKRFGRLFQLEDDYLDLWGQKGRERIGNDIAEGKISFLVAWAFESSSLSPPEKAELKRVLLLSRKETSDEMVAWAILCLEKAGAKKQALLLKDEMKSLKGLSAEVSELGSKLLKELQSLQK